MDQFVSRMGRRDQALLIDCTDLSSELVTANLPGYSWLVIDSGKRQGLVDSNFSIQIVDGARLQEVNGPNQRDARWRTGNHSRIRYCSCQRAVERIS